MRAIDKMEAIGGGKQARLLRNEGEKYMGKQCRHAPKEVSPNLKGIVDVSCEAPPAKKEHQASSASVSENQKNARFARRKTLALDFLCT